MRFNLWIKLLIVVSALDIISNGMAQEPITSLKPVLPNYNSKGRELPAGVPRVVDTNGNVVYIKHSFTTAAFQAEALKLVIQEANRVAQELKLPEELPITRSNLVESFVGPFGFTYAYNKIGNITTKHYMYGIEQGDKFSNLVIAHYDQACLNYEKQSLPIEQMNTNAAYQLATQWLAAASMDVKGLNRDYQVHIALSPYWNGLATLGEKPRKQFVPIYFVWWTNDPKGRGSVADVELFEPTKTLLQLSVQDPKYILRKPLVFTNLAALFPGVAPIYTNYPVKTTYPPPPGD